MLNELNFKKFQDFFGVYEHEKSLIISDFDKKHWLHDSIKFKCRFCGKTKPEASFKKDAHVIPQFLGNRFVISSYECDTCNHLFSQYEDSFANYLSPYRPFSAIDNSRNKKHPKHKETKTVDNLERTKLSIQQIDENRIEIHFQHPFENAVEIDKEKRELIINATKKPYIPIYVFKMLVKIAMTVIEESELPNFSKTLKFLQDNSQNEKLTDFGLCRVFMHAIYGPPLYVKPTINIFKARQNTTKLIPNRTVILHTSNHIYQIFIPFNELDQHLENKITTLYPFPNLIDERRFDEGLKAVSYSDLMSGSKKLHDQTHTMSFSFESADYFKNDNLHNSRESKDQ